MKKKKKKKKRQALLLTCGSKVGFSRVRDPRVRPDRKVISIKAMEEHKGDKSIYRK